MHGTDEVSIDYMGSIGKVPFDALPMETQILLKKAALVQAPVSRRRLMEMKPDPDPYPPPVCN